MSGAFGYEMDLGKCTREEKEIIRQQVETYKARYELLHGGDYYRLTSPFQDSAYTAWEQVSPDKREALVSVVLGCTHAAPPFRTLPLRGLDPKLNYQAEGTGRSCFDCDALLRRAGSRPCRRRGALHSAPVRGRPPVRRMPQWF